jgi:hypothetical protein
MKGNHSTWYWGLLNSYDKDSTVLKDRHIN